LPVYSALSDEGSDKPERLKKRRIEDGIHGRFRESNELGKRRFSLLSDCFSYMRDCACCMDKPERLKKQKE
jgi:hypothetical protein